MYLIQRCSIAFLCLFFVQTSAFAQFGQKIGITDLYNGRTVAVTADMDGDGDIDVLSASVLDSTIHFHENLGGGVFAKIVQIDHQFPFCYDIQTPDIDEDGDPDVLVSSPFTPRMSWYQNLGNGNFGNEQPMGAITVGSLWYEAFDVDGDLDIDIAWVDISNDFWWFENLGGGSYSAPQSIPYAGVSVDELITMDINGDNLEDLVMHGFNLDVHWKLKSGRRQFWTLSNCGSHQ